MPRKKLMRRCELRYGVSREMLEAEAEYVAREAKDYLLLSTKDLQTKLAEVRLLWGKANEALEEIVKRLGEREKLAVQCLIVRDLYHLLELHCVNLHRGVAETPAPVVADAPTPNAHQAKENSLPFSEWLFDPGT